MEASPEVPKACTHYGERKSDSKVDPDILRHDPAFFLCVATRGEVEERSAEECLHISQQNSKK